MNWNDWIEKWGMSSLKINMAFMILEFKPNDSDRNAAWELYIELLTRITTQSLNDEDGDEAAALASVYSLFPLTREIIKRHGRGCSEFSKIAIVILNQIVRPFTAKWHKHIKEDAFTDKNQCIIFRVELEEIQNVLRIYTKMLADMAGVEDLSELEII